MTKRERDAEFKLERKQLCNLLGERMRTEAACAENWNETGDFLPKRLKELRNQMSKKNLEAYVRNEWRTKEDCELVKRYQDAYEALGGHSLGCSRLYFFMDLDSGKIFIESGKHASYFSGSKDNICVFD